MNLKILNKKEINKLLNLIKNQFSITNLELNFVFFSNEENKIFIASKKIHEFDLNKLRINNIGLYLAKIEQDGIRLSIEGSQLIGQKVNKNFIELDFNEAKLWFLGHDLEYNGNEKGYVILKHKNDFLGCGKVKNNKILNFIDKGRRIKTEDILYFPMS